MLTREKCSIRLKKMNRIVAPAPSIIVPRSFQSAATPFGDLLLNRYQALRMAKCFEKCLAGSFQEDARRNGQEFARRIQTEAEVKRRADMLGRWFRRFRGDLGYSISQCEAELPRALRAEMDGQTYSPPAAGKLYGAAEGEV